MTKRKYFFIANAMLLANCLAKPHIKRKNEMLNLATYLNDILEAKEKIKSLFY
ncbi:MAG: hypothetical protein ABIE47_17920 [Pseudomonadota bacterium]